MLTIRRGPAEGGSGAAAAAAAAAAATADGLGAHRFECRTCPYVYRLDKPYFETKRFARPKGAAEILGGSESFERLERVEARCRDDGPGGCDGRSAYVYQLQIRSADEPMTTFFTCTKCLKRWQEN